MKRKKNTDGLLVHINPDALVANGFEEAYLGFVRRASRPTVACYDYVTCVEILMRDEGYNKKQAVMFMEDFMLQYTEGGDNSPAFAFWKDEYDED